MLYINYYNYSYFPSNDSPGWQIAGEVDKRQSE